MSIQSEPRPAPQVHADGRNDGNRLLRIYLADHRAGAAAGLARARRFANANSDTALGESATEVQRQIRDDVATLDEVIDRLGHRPSPWKNGLARAVELAGRLKPNGRLRGYSPLSRMIELELLIAGILTKESLWQTLAEVQALRPELAGFDFDDLEHRAMRQRMELEAHRRSTVHDAFERSALIR
jgi:hypothetical protein